MNALFQAQPLTWPRAAWITLALSGLLAPAAALVLLADSNTPLSILASPILAVGLMGAGMIGAAVVGRLGTGLLFAFAAGGALLLIALALGMSGLMHPLSVALVVGVASLSFAARGALFALSALDKGWFIAVFVVFGEAAMLATAIAMPGALPSWLLVLLPAQWATMALNSALVGTGALAAWAALIALASTAAATLVVARLWPARWPYLIMFSTWLALSAVVWHYPAPTAHHLGAKLEAAAP